ncbi:MAG: 16S rRNA (cytidine(1402)-2'-O)-methyltransferase [Gammaproteobacteria bacterium]|nr:16S rRNA (cytidine(1402)-2'-O)-methyltransferase [Gammaproteobacteria bacterium]
MNSNTIKSGTLYVVATPIGNLDDISKRALQVLENVDLVAAEDTRHSRKLLSFFGLEKHLLSLHEHNERDKTGRLLEKLEAGQSIALISDAGTPLISDPGYPLVNECRIHGIDVIPVPGPSAVITALSVSGLPTDSFIFCGFPPRQAGKRRKFFESLKKNMATLVFYESSHRITDCLDDALAVFGHDRYACVARELTKLYETVKTASLIDLQDFISSDPNQHKGEFVLMIQGVSQAEKSDDSAIDVDELLAVLLEELPVKKAAVMAAKLTEHKKNELYQRALEIKEK